MPTPSPSPDPLAHETRYLGGKVIKWSLPALEPPFAPDAPVLKRILLAQGELAQIYDAEEPVRYLACLQLLPGTVRGNHYHKVKRECVYLVQGELTLVVRDVHTSAREALTLRPGELALVEPGVAHAMVVATGGVAVEFAQSRFDAEDTFRYPCAAV